MAPGMTTPFFCHANERFGPDAVIENVAVNPVFMVCEEGCVVIMGADELTVSETSVLVMLPALLLTMHLNFRPLSARATGEIV